MSPCASSCFHSDKKRCNPPPRKLSLSLCFLPLGISLIEKPLNLSLSSCCSWLATTVLHMWPANRRNLPQMYACITGACVKRTERLGTSASAWDALDSGTTGGATRAFGAAKELDLIRRLKWKALSDDGVTSVARRDMEFNSKLMS